MIPARVRLDCLSPSTRPAVWFGGFVVATELNAGSSVKGTGSREGRHDGPAGSRCLVDGGRARVEAHGSRRRAARMLVRTYTCVGAVQDGAARACACGQGRVGVGARIGGAYACGLTALLQCAATRACRKEGTYPQTPTWASVSAGARHFTNVDCSAVLIHAHQHHDHNCLPCLEVSPMSSQPHLTGGGFNSDNRVPGSHDEQRSRAAGSSKKGRETGSRCNNGGDEAYAGAYICRADLRALIDHPSQAYVLGWPNCTHAALRGKGTRRRARVR